MDRARPDRAPSNSRRREKMQALGASVASLLLLASCSGGSESSDKPSATSPQITREYPWSNGIDNSPEATKRCNRPDDAPVLFTFDDSGTDEQIKTLLGVLHEENIRAAFFPIGEWAEHHIDLIDKIKEDGHYVGNHTQTHARLGKLAQDSSTEAKFYQEIYPLEDQQDNVPVANTLPLLLRPPFEDGAYDPTVEERLKQKGFQECTWTADSRDWDGSTANQIVKRLRHGDQYSEKVEPHGVILFHMLGEHTSEAIPKVVGLLNEEHIPYEKMHQ